MKEIIFLLTLEAVIVSGILTCIGENGEPVDMYILYKLPEIKWHKVPDIVSSGKGYVYMDSNNLQFQFGGKSIESEKSPPGRTLDQVYRNYKQKDTNDEKMAHIFYNDANPEGKEFFTYGHTKGALAFNKESGFWLISSVPKYPPHTSDGYGYPHTGFLYGQLMMCITFNSSYFNNIGLQLQYTNPHIHDANMPIEWEEQYPNIKELLDGKRVKNSPFTNVAMLTSLGGVAYQHFAKASGFHKDLYLDLVAPGLMTNLLAETWQHGKNIGPSCDGKYTVVDVIDLNITLAGQMFPFKNYNDHAKFSIGDKQAAPYVCVGDINRQPSQFKRGGGTMCINNSDIWKQFYNIIVNCTSCNKLEDTNQGPRHEL